MPRSWLPVAVERFRWDQPRDDVYLCLCRLVPYKRVDLVVAAFNRLGLPLLVVGDGPGTEPFGTDGWSNGDHPGPTIPAAGGAVAGSVSPYVYAGLEDFGIAPVEAMASGAPVIGLGRGGLLDTVRCAASGMANATGVLFPDQTVESLTEAVRWFERRQLWQDLDAAVLRQWAEHFRPEAFAQRFGAILQRAWTTHQQRCLLAASDPGGMLKL